MSSLFPLQLLIEESSHFVFFRYYADQMHQRDSRTQLFSTVPPYNSGFNQSASQSRVGTPLYGGASGNGLGGPSGLSSRSGISGSGTGTASPYQSDSMLDSLESQNDKQIEGLSAKVKLLKDLTVRIGDEVRDSNKLLTDLENNFENARTKLKGTFQRMIIMADKAGISWRMWLIFFGLIFLVFFYVWWR